jgi:hypothetical protein
MVPDALQTGRFTAPEGEDEMEQPFSVTTPTYPVVLAVPVMVEVAAVPAETEAGVVAVKL